MKKHFLNLALWALIPMSLCVTGCSDDDTYPDVDGQTPVAEMNSLHIQTAAGRTFTIEGTLTDADGIATIHLQCEELYLNKTIDLIEIYGEPQTEYELSYNFAMPSDEIGDLYMVTVTTTDTGGRSVTQDVKVTLDGDFEDPVFVSGAPDEGSIVPVILREGETPKLGLNFSMSDDRGLDYLELNIEGIEGFPKRIDLGMKTTGEYADSIAFPAEIKDYAYTVALADTIGKIVTRTATIRVTDVMDYEKMYIADVATEAELNSDVFGVPMCIDHTGEYEYQAIYYNAEAGTEVYFIPTPSSFAVRYGVNSEDNTALTNDPNLVQPLVLDQANVYYIININIWDLTYEIEETYSVEEAQDPWGTDMTYGEECFDLWGNGSEYIAFTFGLTSDNPTGVKSFIQDETNPHIFYSEPMELTTGEQMNFIIHNYHKDQWWNAVRWCSISETDLDVFSYYTQSASKNPAYTGPTTGQDVWSKPTVTTGGTYRFYFDSHLGRAKLVRE